MAEVRTQIRRGKKSITVTYKIFLCILCENSIIVNKIIPYCKHFSLVSGFPLTKMYIVSAKTYFIIRVEYVLRICSHLIENTFINFEHIYIVH